MALRKFAVETIQNEGEITFEADVVHSLDCDINFIIPRDGIPQDSIYIFAYGVAKIVLVTTNFGKITAWLVDKLNKTIATSLGDTVKTIWANPEMLRKEVRR